MEESARPDEGFDVEAQQSLLQKHEPEIVREYEQTGSARQALATTILLIRSIEAFKLGANKSSGSSTSSPHRDHRHPSQGSRKISPLEISVDSAEEAVPNAHPVSNTPLSYERKIELQQIQKNKIAEIVKTKNWAELFKFGGVRGVAEALNTNPETGLLHCPQQSSIRPSMQNKSNRKPFLQTLAVSFLGAWKNWTVFFLVLAAILSYVFGIKEDGISSFGWFNGAVLTFSVVFIISCKTISKCYQAWSNEKLENSWHKRGSEKNVLTIRDGECHLVGEVDLEEGDLVILRKGDQVPADGLFIGSTGGDRPFELNDGSGKSLVVDENNPFLFYGSRIVNGNAKFLVTSTGVATVWGETMSHAVAEKENDWKFESYIHKLIKRVHIWGLLISILIIIALFLRYDAGKKDDERRNRPEAKGEPAQVKTILDSMFEIITRAKGTTIVFAKLLGISLLGIIESVTLVISMAIMVCNRKTLAAKATQRGYLSCLKMASVTIFCTDEFGGLTGREKDIDRVYIGRGLVTESCAVGSQVLDGIHTQFLVSRLIGDESSGELTSPILSWAEANLGLKRDDESGAGQCKVMSHRGKDPFRECVHALIKKNGDDEAYYLHSSGLPVDILSMCSHQYEINGEIKEIDGQARDILAGTICDMLAEGTNVIAYANKPIDPNLDVTTVTDHENDLIFLAMISLKDVDNEEDTRKAISALNESGVRMIIASEKDVSTLETTARKFALITPGSDDQILTGDEFRELSDEDKIMKSDKIRIMGNCLPSDKTLFIECLRKKGHSVALLAQRTVDAPALKRANVGLTFGTWSSRIARECCGDIHIFNPNCLDFVPYIINEARHFQNGIRRFIQLHLIFTVSSTMINLVAAVSLGDSPINPVQLFWLSLVVAFLGGMALLPGPTAGNTAAASNYPITKATWRNIAVQVSYQSSVFVSLQHRGQAILGTRGGDGRVKWFVYNGFVLCQLFGMFVAREPDRRNIFAGLMGRGSFWFWSATVIFLICQAVFGMAERAVSSSALPCFGRKVWGVWLAVGLGSWLMDLAGKCAFKLVFIFSR